MGLDNLRKRKIQERERIFGGGSLPERKL